MSDVKHNIAAVCFGEVLIDNFPTHSKIGGAPLNVSSRMQSYGIQVSMISSVGEDKHGANILNFLKDKGICVDGVTTQKEYPTGEVNVEVNDKGIASYDIAYPVAWDKIKIFDIHEGLVKNSDIFIFGSLVCRDEESWSTLKALLSIAPYKVFDVNLRAPHYTYDRILELMNEANFIKFNDDELYEIADFLGSHYNAMEQTIAFISEKTNTDIICVTKGAYGAVLYNKGTFFYNSGYRINVVDTVGSGDSFLASVIFKLFNNCDSQEAIDFACAVGALVAGSSGANPVISTKKIADYMNP